MINFSKMLNLEQNPLNNYEVPAVYFIDDNLNTVIQNLGLGFGSKFTPVQGSGN